METLNQHMPMTEEATEAARAIFAAYSKALHERDLYAAQAKINAQTVVRQQHEIRRLERDIARLLGTRDTEEHDEFVKRFGL